MVVVNIGSVCCSSLSAEHLSKQAMGCLLLGDLCNYVLLLYHPQRHVEHEAVLSILTWHSVR